MIVDMLCHGECQDLTQGILIGINRVRCCDCGFEDDFDEEEYVQADESGTCGES